MKLLLLALIAFILPTAEADITDYLNLDTPLKFNDTEYYLAWSDHPRDNYYVQEYLPKDEKLDKFNQMMHMNLFLVDLTVEQTVKSKIKELEVRKTHDGTCHYEVNKSPDGKEMIVDFTLGESKDGLMEIAEFNIYHYSKVEINGEEAVAILAYSKRAYGDDIIPFFKDLKKSRIKYLKAFIELDKPKINFKSE